MPRLNVLVWIIAATLVVVSTAWSESITAYPLDDLNLVRSKAGVVFDKGVSSDGKGTVWIDDIRLLKLPLP